MGIGVPATSLMVSALLTGTIYRQDDNGNEMQTVIANPITAREGEGVQLFCNINTGWIKINPKKDVLLAKPWMLSSNHNALVKVSGGSISTSRVDLSIKFFSNTLSLYSFDRYGVEADGSQVSSIVIRGGIKVYQTSPVSRHRVRR